MAFIPNRKFALLFLVLSSLVVSCSKTDSESSQKSEEKELLLHVPSPDWRDQVIYFLMTDRFNDGNPENNDQGFGEYDPAHESHYSGGDIQGVIEQLDYIENLGATAVWLTPIVANQWWSSHNNYGGYHGYWATDFSSVDPHKGTLDTYQTLSDQLHRRGMYLVKDIVVNHTGNFFNYKGGHSGYDPDDTAQNFYLFEDENSPQPAPTQSPFDLIDRNNPEHVAANIYNWTPSITDYKNADHQFTYQLATLADLNTRNPVVIDRFKEIYGDWIKKAGVDAFRIDTVRYVEHEFFHHFMHDEDGIHAVAKETGRDNFLAFGEVFDTSKPYENDAEKRVAAYLGTEQKPELNSIISFPLHHELKTVFAQGMPTSQLAYRMQQHMEVYPDPYMVPTFIDNHDMERFLASGDVAGFKQALAAIFTIPGIPTIYQGSAQAMTESRKAMFKGGFNADRDYFDQSSELFQYISSLAKLRTGNRIFTRGDLEILAANDNGPGLLAYKRNYEGKQVIVLFNTSRHEILANDIEVSDGMAKLNLMFGDDLEVLTDSRGRLTTTLPGRSVKVAELVSVDATEETSTNPTIDTVLSDAQVTEDFIISGTTAKPNSRILLVKNTRLDTSVELFSDDSGRWQYQYPVVNLGIERVSLVAFQPEIGAVSQPFEFVTQVDRVAFEINHVDGSKDDVGLIGTYRAPTHKQSRGQQDIIDVDIQSGGEVLQMTFTMRELTDDWIPANGFDNVAFSIFFDFPEKEGLKVLPLINSQMPENKNWDMGHVVYGWGNTAFSSEDADAQHHGKRYGVAPVISVNKDAKTISFRYSASDFDIDSWLGSAVYITTWDITGEGMYRDLQPDSSDWSYGGGNHNDPKILDWVLLEIPGN